ncbi:MAG: hypothetical protein V1743_01120 [Nanoarchaeota archaeon]
MKQLEILVVEDSPIHQEAAREQLGTCHNVTVVGSFDEAMDKLERSRQSERYYSLVSQSKALECLLYRYKKGSEERAQISKQLNELGDEMEKEIELFQKPNRYEVMLIDLMLPQGRGECQSDTTNAGEIQSFGYALALIAGKYGIPNIGVVTDGNHHKGAMIYAMDFLGCFNPYQKPLRIGEGKVFFSTQENDVSETGHKNWKKVVDALTGEE